MEPQKCMKQKLGELAGEIDSSTMVAAYFSTYAQ